MVVSGSLPALRGLFLLPAQLLGAICAAAVVSAIIPGDIAIVQTTLAPGMSIAQGVFLEMVWQHETSVNAEVQSVNMENIVSNIATRPYHPHACRREVQS